MVGRNTVISEWDAGGVMAVVRCKIGEVGRRQISQGLCVMPTKDGEHSEYWFGARIGGKRPPIGLVGMDVSDPGER